MHSRCAKRRSQRADQLLGGGFPDRRSLFVRHAKETIAHAHAVFSRARYFQGDVMKLTASGARVESRFIGTITDQIIAFLVGHYFLDSAGQIVVIANSDAA